ncbi:Cytochrome P450 94C1-like protein [Drosera capensis]
MSSQNPHNNELFFVIFSILTILLLLFILTIYFLKLRSRWCNCDICRAYLTSSWTKDFKNLQDWYTFLLRNSPTKTVHIHILNNTITANPSNVEYMLKTNFNNYPKGKAFSMILGDLLGRGIFNVDGESWRFQRKMASLELDNMAIRSYGFDIVREEIERRLLPMLASVAGKNDAVLDLQDVFRRFTFDMICRFSFRLDPECLELSLPMSKFANSFDLASKLSAERALNVWPLIWKIKRAFNIGSEKQLRQAIQVVDTLAKEVIRQRRKLGFNNQNDLLSRFMLKVHDEGYLRDIIVSFLLAGRDTVASALTGFFHLIGTHPAVVSKILEEADRVIGPSHCPAGLMKSREMQYLNAAIHEAMRLYPPVQFDSKFCLDDDVLPDGSFVRRGTRVTYHSYAMGRMKDIWGLDCIEFRPERWLGGPNGVFLQECPFKYPVYQGGGVRVCIGKEMSLMVIKNVILSVLREYQVELAEPARVRPIFSPGLTANFLGGLPVLVHKRSDTDEH